MAFFREITFSGIWQYPDDHSEDTVIGSNSGPGVCEDLGIVMSSLGIALPIKMTTDTITVPGVANFTEPVGLLNFQVNGQSQYFTGWGQFL